MSFLGAIAVGIQENLNFGENHEEAHRALVYSTVSSLTRSKTFMEKLSETEIFKVLYGIMFVKSAVNYRDQSEGMYICEQKYSLGLK